MEKELEDHYKVRLFCFLCKKDFTVLIKKGTPIREDRALLTVSYRDHDTKTSWDENIECPICGNTTPIIISLKDEEKE